uniref:Uncharacterized protein n=1 Tax=Arundo donax TaxID=35708 RepID=A0A0A9CGA9_ARUDO
MFVMLVCLIPHNVTYWLLLKQGIWYPLFTGDLNSEQFLLLELKILRILS